MSQGLTEFELWSRTSYPGYEVVGESHYEQSFRQLFPGRVGPGGREFEGRATLFPEPTNRFDRGAVAVVVNGVRVGYLPREDSGVYQAVFLHLQHQGLVGVAPCTVRVYEREEWQGTDRRGRDIVKNILVGSVRLVLDEPWMCIPVTSPPRAPHVLLPHGTAVQVRKDEDHLNELLPHLRSQGESWVHATLHSVVGGTAKSPKTLIEVHIDGQVVGELTPAMSSEYRPIVEQLEASGRQTAVRAVVKGNQLKADVVLYAAKSSQLDARWVAANVPAGLPPRASVPSASMHAPVPPKPTGIKFNPPPTWPPAPAGWEPPPGWTPPADWAPAPQGWVYWIAV